MKKILLNLIIVLTLFSCSISTSSPRTGNLSLNLNGLKSRTVLPDMATVLPDTYVITYIKGPVSRANDTINSATKTLNDFEPGKWQISVTASMSGNIVASGSSSEFTINSNATTDVSVELILSQANNGNTEIKLDWNVKPGSIDSVTATLEKIGGASSNITGDVTLSGNTATYSGNISSGDYIISIKLNDDKGNLVLPYGEIIQVYDYLDSDKIVNFTLDEFNSTPKDPSNVTAVEGTNSIDITWTDESNIETGYVIERTNDNGSNWTKLADLPPGSDSYNDTGVTKDITYKYQVKAVGIYGDSGYAESGNVKLTLPVPGNSGSITANNITHNSFKMTWTAANDTDGSTLKYKVVISKNDDIDSVADANINSSTADKILVMDWATIPTMPYSVTSLNSSTDYYINVLVQDANENIISYNVISSSTTKITTAAAPGNLGISITIKDIHIENIVFKKGNGDPISNGFTMEKHLNLSLKTESVYDEYTWYVDGDKIDKANLPNGYTFIDATATVSEKMQIAPNTLGYGQHNIMVVCKKDSHSYSQNLRIVVEN